MGDQGALPWENNLYVSESSTDGALEDLLEHAQDVSLWIAVEICSASSLKVSNSSFFFNSLLLGLHSVKAKAFLKLIFWQEVFLLRER